MLRMITKVDAEATEKFMRSLRKAHMLFIGSLVLGQIYCLVMFAFIIYKLTITYYHYS